MNSEHVPLSPPVAALAADIALREDGFAWDEAVLVGHLRGMVDRPSGEHRALAVEVLALILKLEREAAAHTLRARAQLFVLFAALAEGATAALLAEAGVDVDARVQQAIGAAASKLPVGA